MRLDFTVFENALLSLERAIQRSAGVPDDEEVRDAVIKRFGCSMDLAWKFMQRALKHATVSEAHVRTKRDLFRESAQLGLIADPTTWFAYYEARNETSHTYAREVADRGAATARLFLPEAQAFLSALSSLTMIDVSQEALALIRAILQRHVPGCEVLAFGSRVNRTASVFSDLEIAFMTEHPLDYALLAEVRDAFSEFRPALPGDVLDWASLSPEFQALILESNERILPANHIEPS